MSVDNFIGAVKVKRDDAIEWFNKTIEDNGGIFPVEELATGIDTLVGGVLDVLEEQYTDIIAAETEDGTEAIVTCASDLSTLYFEEVSN